MQQQRRNRERLENYVSEADHKLGGASIAPGECLVIHARQFAKRYSHKHAARQRRATRAHARQQPISTTHSPQGSPRPPLPPSHKQGSRARSACWPCVHPVSRPPPPLHPTTGPVNHPLSRLCARYHRRHLAACPRHSLAQHGAQQPPGGGDKPRPRLRRRQPKHAPLLLGLRLGQHLMGCARKL